MGHGYSALKWLNRSLEMLPRFGVFPAPARIPTATPNTFYSERENPTFESPISASRSMLDMLIQSWGGVIRVFPAMPTKWKDARFHQLRTEGAFLISAVRKEGKTQFISVKSLEGKPCIIKSDFTGTVKITGPSTTNMVQQDGQITLHLKKGEEALLYTGARPKTFIIAALPVKPGEMNSWGGSKK